MENKHEDIIEIDLLQLCRALLHRAWIIVLVTILTGALTATYTMYMVTPLYTSNVLVYVNSNDITLGQTKVSISQGDLAAAQSLVDTYAVILNSRNTLNSVIERGDLDYSYEELSKMISSASVNGTEIFSISVTNPDPEEAALIANTIARVLPGKIASIVEGSSARIVDMAVVARKPTSPSISRNTILGALVGMLLSCAVIVIRELMDDMVYDTDYLIQTFNLPVLAAIPDLLESKSGSYYQNYYYGGSDKSEKQ